MSCVMSRLYSSYLPDTFNTYLDPGKHVITFTPDIPNVNLDEITLTVMCMTSAPESFALTAQLGSIIRGFPSCPTKSFGNISTTLPIDGDDGDGGDGGDELILTLESYPSLSSEWYTIDSVIQKSCNIDYGGTPWWIYLLIVLFALIAVAAIAIFCICPKAPH